MPANLKKKKRRPRKPKRKDGKKVSVDESRDASRSNRPEFEVFLDEMVRWFSDQQQQVIQYFSLRDADQSGSVNLKDFEIGLMNLGLPAQRLQLHTLAELLKNSNNMILYQDLKKQIQMLSSSSSSTEVKGHQDVSGLQRPADDRLFKPNKDRFIHLGVRLISFDCFPNHPGNFEVVLSSRTRVFGLIRIIQDRVGVQTSRLEVFRSRTPTEDGRLPVESSLEECGLSGGPEDSPAEDTVYYDYGLVLTDCPVLNCDHYLRSKPRVCRRGDGTLSKNYTQLE